MTSFDFKQASIDFQHLHLPKISESLDFTTKDLFVKNVVTEKKRITNLDPKKERN